MDLPAIGITKISLQPSGSQPTADLQKAAKQFEAILLTQLTSVLSGTNNDDEDKLFGSDAGAGMAQQMFAEQLAQTLADAGGIGLADLISKRFGADKTNKSAQINAAKTDAPTKNAASKNVATPKAVASSRFENNSREASAVAVAPSDRELFVTTRPRIVNLAKNAVGEIRFDGARLEVPRTSDLFMPPLDDATETKTSAKNGGFEVVQTSRADSDEIAESRAAIEQQASRMAKEMNAARPAKHRR